MRYLRIKKNIPQKLSAVICRDPGTGPGRCAMCCFLVIQAAVNVRRQNVSKNKLINRSAFPDLFRDPFTLPVMHHT